ncbi:MAG TPA: hypothetical protein VFZ32_12640 [Micromonosporaceae bacterium]
MVPTAIISSGLMAVGVAVAMLGAYQLGLARAARKWDSADRSPRIGRGMATVGVLLGLLLLAVGAATLTTLVELPDATPAARTGLGIAAGVLTFALGMYGTARMADRVELNTLIRTPSRFRRLPPAGSAPAAAEAASPEPRSDPVVPPTARPGWVYRDAGGTWYLVVSAGAGYRLVSLPDFRLVPIGMVREPVTTAGSVELAVWPLSEAPGVREGEAHQAAT